MTYRTTPSSRTAIEELHSGAMNVTIIGVILGKTDPKGFQNRKSPEKERFTFDFVLRDSPNYFINVECWGDDIFIHNLSRSFRIGEVEVKVQNPLVRTKDIEQDEKFRPWTPSPYKLTLSENHSAVALCSGEEGSSMMPLLHLPTKESHDYYTLSDILANGQNLQGEVINILVGVRTVSEPKAFVTKDNRPGQNCDVILFDETVNSFHFVLWNKEAIQLAQTWEPRKTVIFAADVKVSFDKYRQSMVATAISKTIITTNPNTQEAQLLFTYANDYFAAGNFEEDISPEGLKTLDFNTIKDVFTIEQMKEKEVSLRASESPVPVWGVACMFVSMLNVDDSAGKVMRVRCSLCNCSVDPYSQVCTNDNCDATLLNNTVTVRTFEMQMEIADYTGSLNNCWVTGAVAEKMLGCTVDAFSQMTDVQKTELKWRVLLERCKIYFKQISNHIFQTGRRLFCIILDFVSYSTKNGSTGHA
uniref:Methionine sulfoxide reductase B1b n=1 Tax=Petromyzon marinus TaxID=7757 RepID=S4R4D8_PETMA